ncbi:MAG: hypothetical protein QXZ20_01570 [Candidatus Aenigmatarchaeota archaeon]
MKKWFIFFILFFSFFLKELSAQEFSAQLLQKTQSGNFVGKIFVKKDRTRVEVGDNITITRLDKKVIWILMPNNTYIEHPLTSMSLPFVEEKIFGEIERTFLEEQEIGGRLTKKYKIVYEVEGKKYTVYQWIDNELKLPLRTESEDGSFLWEYKNIKVEKQPDFLFEIPSGYSKFEVNY